MSEKSAAHHSFRTFAVKHPYKAYLSIVIPLSFLAVGILAISKLPTEPGLLLLVYGGLLGMALRITYWKEGKKGVYELLKRVVKWRVGIGYYVLALVAIPALTILISSITGSFKLPAGGWEELTMKYAITLFSGALIINLWEETGWAGFFQTRIMKEKGLLKGSLLTAAGFAAVHLPLALAMPGHEAVLYPFVLLLLAPFFRYLIGVVLLETGGSLLIVGLLHASFNASNTYGIPQVIAAVIILAILAAGYRKIRNKSVV